MSAITTNYVSGGPEDAQTNLRTRYTYNALGAYTHVTDPLNHTTVYTYDGAGRISTQQDALGYVTSFGYDALGRRVSVTAPDAAGSQTTTTHYDVLGRVLRVDYPANGDAEAFSVSHAYDALGRRSAMTDTTGVTTWTYDALGRMTGVSDPFTGTIAYGYDAVGNRTVLTTTHNAQPTTTYYAYAAANRLISVSDWTTGTTSYGYDAAGRILTTTLPNNVISTYDYDVAGRQVGLRHEGITSTLATYTYTLDALGRQVAVAESLRAGVGLTVTTRVISYTFDGARRLSHSAYSTGEAFAYQYDAAGNRIVVTGTTPVSGTVVTTNSYDAANRLTARSRSDGHAYTYDWSQRGQLLTEWTQGYPVRAFSYDGAGRMIQARVFTQTTEFVYNGLGARLAVNVDGYGTTHYTLDYAAGHRILAETTPTSTVSYLYGHDCLGEQRGDEWLYYLPDAEGYVRQGADADGEVVSAWLFDPDGTVLEGPNGPVSHLICGGVYDWSTGLIYRGGRYFDPNLGIWLALTPLLMVQGWTGKKKGRGRRLWMVMLCVAVAGTLTGCPPDRPQTVTPTPTRTPVVDEMCTTTPTPIATGTTTPSPDTPTSPPPTYTLPPPTDTPRPPDECVPVLPEPVGPLPTSADAQEAAKATGAELDTPNKIPDLPGWQNFDRWVKNTQNRDVEIVSFMWGDYDNRDRAFVAIVWTIRNRVDIHYGEGGENRFSSCSSITSCAKDNNYQAYAANRGYISSPYEEQVAMQVLRREREDPTGGAVYFRDTSMDPGCGKPFCVTNLEEMDPNVYEKLKHPAPRGFNFCPLCEENTGG